MHMAMNVAPQDGTGTARPLHIPIDEQRWLSLDVAVDGAALLALFFLCPWSLQESAAHALAAANLRERAGPPIAVGVYRDALVVSLRMNPALPTPVALEESAGELLRFVARCTHR